MSSKSATGPRQAKTTVLKSGLGDAKRWLTALPKPKLAWLGAWAPA